MTTTTEGTGQGSAEGPLRGFDLDNIRKVFINQGGVLYPCIYIVGSGTDKKYVLRVAADGQVKIDSTDEADYLGDKLVAGTNITLVPSAGPNKTLTINSTASAADEKVKIDALDSTAGYLSAKLLAGSNITLTTSVGPNKDITVSASGNPVVVDIGAVGSSFSPSVLSITSVIKGTVGANFTMTDLTITDGVTDKMQMRVELTQTGGGGDISSWSANFNGSDLVPLTSVGLSIGAGKTDILVFEWDSARVKWNLVGFFNGIAP